MKNVYYHLSDHAYITQFRDELILLNTKRDRYTTCFQEYTDILTSLLETTCVEADGNLIQNPIVQQLLNDKIIEIKDKPYPFHIDRKINSHGVSNVDWNLPIKNEPMKIDFDVLRSFIKLCVVNFYMKVRGFYSTIQLIKNSRKTQSNYFIPKDEDLMGLVNSLNRACLIYPIRTKCLEWSIAFVLLALKRKWKCNLEIGVQNYPFFAHAWVECNDKIIMDEQFLREELAIILNEPFRNLKR